MMKTDNAPTMSRREFLKAFGMLGGGALMATMPKGAQAAEPERPSEREACVGEAGYARRMADLFSRAPTRRIKSAE